jgi:ribosomal protein S6--L-glutamate ligase
MSISVGFLLGARPGPHSILPGVVARLRGQGAAVSLTLWSSGGLPSELFASDLVVLRGLSAPAIRAAQALEMGGVRCCNSVASTRRARQKPTAFAALLDAGVPIPRTEVALAWDEACRLAADREGVVLKAVNGSRGAGVLIAPAGTLPPKPPFAGPYLLQDYVPCRGPDRKVYVIGDRLAGVARCWPANGIRDKLGRPFIPDRTEEAIAVAAGAALGLEIYGVDLIASEDGPVVVDVNAFPGFKGIEGAAESIADHLLDGARAEQEAARCAS